MERRTSEKWMSSYWSTNESTDHQRLDAGHQLNERSLEKLWTQDTRQRFTTLDELGMLDMNDCCDQFHHYNSWVNTLTDELAHPAKETGQSWGVYEGRPAAISVFFDGGVNSAGESKQGDKFPGSVGWVMQTSDTWRTGQDPRWETEHGTTVTQAANDGRNPSSQVGCLNC